MKTPMKFLAVLTLILPTMASAQNAEQVPGPYLLATPTAPYGLQNYRYNCSTTTPISGLCNPYVTILGADGVTAMSVNPLGQMPANLAVGVALPSTQVSTDPCMLQIKTSVSFSIPAGTSIFQVVAPQGSPPVQTHVCKILLNPDVADRVSFFEGTGALCGTSTVALLGALTGAAIDLTKGMSVGTTNGWIEGNGGAEVYTTHNSGDGFCIGHTVTTSNIVAGSMEIIRQ
jgi:hypothetical protein